MNQPRNLAYDEVKDHLAVRIRAHTKFANFQLETWFAENLKIPPGGALLEIGCGDGNWFKTWAGCLGAEGFIAGIDKNEELIARGAARKVACRKLLLRMDFNDLTAFLPETFDCAVAPYSIYYADDARETMEAIRSLLKEGSWAYLIGPTERNADELYQLNKLLFGFESDDPTKRRACRIEEEFLPAAEELFAEVASRRVPRMITFPSLDHYCEYYRATLLFRESCKKAGRTPSAGEIADCGWENLDLSKEVVVVEARR
ncbi:MAG: class I SAM-dependent methyltransferase [Nitrospinota bacterium]|jgi:ubiquinone/menaquinone biosynthesis C-methylase UbiE|nr:class I SAM-dependent methyltransferase [Nitrospinota bacterium]